MKSVVMIGGGIQQIEAVNTAKKLGFFTIVTDKNKNAPCFNNADLGLVSDGTDVVGISKFIIENKKRYNIQGVFTCINLASSVSKIAKRCQLPGADPIAAARGDNKIDQKKLFSKNNIPTPKFKEVKSLHQARQAYVQLGPKVVFKPSDSFGGQGVLKVENWEEIKDAFSNARDNSRKRTVIVEEFISGHFIDLEGIFYKGKFLPLAILDSYFLDKLPGNFRTSPIEYKNVYPSIISTSLKRDLFRLTSKAALLLGINFGPVGSDIVITKNGPMIIEISARLHGSSSNLYLIPKASGLNPVELLIKIVTGQSLKKSEIVEKFNKVGIYKYIFAKPGHIREISGIKKASNLNGIVKVFFFKKKGDEIYYRNSTDVPCTIMAVSRNLEEAEKIVSTAESMIKFKVEAKKIG